jgi:hypothetical protein
MLTFRFYYYIQLKASKNLVSCYGCYGSSVLSLCFSSFNIIPTFSPPEREIFQQHSSNSNGEKCCHRLEASETSLNDLIINNNNDNKNENDVPLGGQKNCKRVTLSHEWSQSHVESIFAPREGHVLFIYDTFCI